MAKINQLSRSYNRRDQSVQRAAVDFRPVSEGLRNISDAYVNQIKMHNDARLQRDKEETMRADYQMKDWVNSYNLAMNSPAKLQEAFNGTIFGDAVPSYMANAQGMESSLYQVDNKNAAHAISQGITSESARKLFVSTQLSMMEDREVVFSQQAQAYTQQNASMVFMENLDRIAKDPKYGPHSDLYRTYSAEGMSLGYMGADATSAYAKMSELQLGYSKAAQEAYIEQATLNEIFGHTDPETGEFVPGLDLATMNPELIDSVSVGADIFYKHGSFITPEEETGARARAAAKAKTIFGAVTKVRDEAKGKLLSQMLYNTMELIDLPNTNPDIDIEKWHDTLIKSKQNYMSYLTKDVGNVATGIKEISETYIGRLDPKEVKKVIDLYDRAIAGDDPNSPQKKEGNLIANRLLYNFEASTAEKKNILDQLLKDDFITISQHKSYYATIDSNETQYKYKKAQEMYTQFKKDYGYEMTKEDDSSMLGRINDFIGIQENMTNTQADSNLYSIFDSYLSDQSYVAGSQAKMSGGVRNLYGFSKSLFGKELRMTPDMKDMVIAAENDEYIHYVKTRPEEINNFNLTMGAAWDTLITETNHGYDVDDLMTVENSLDDRWLYGKAELSGPNGNTWITRALKDQSGAPDGTIEVRVFTPTVDESYIDSFAFAEESKYENYYLAIHSKDDAYVETLEDGSQVLHNISREVVVRGDYGTWKTLTEDPAEYIEGGYDVNN